MTLSDLASIGSLASGVAVLMSLVFVNLQMRQTVKNQQSLMHHGRSLQLSHWLEYIAKPEMQEIMIGGNDGVLDGVVDYGRYQSLVWSMLVNYENNFIQHRSGMLGEEQYAATLGSLRFQFSLPGFRANWLMTRRLFEEHFAASMDELMASTPVQFKSAARGHELWKELAAKEYNEGSSHT